MVDRPLLVLALPALAFSYPARDIDQGVMPLGVRVGDLLAFSFFPTRLRYSGAPGRGRIGG